MLTNMMNRKHRIEIPMPPRAMAVQRLDDEIAEHVEQHVAGEHRDERPQPEAERPDQEANELDRRDQRT